MFAKIMITGTIEVLTGMHIGGSTSVSAIGAIDSPVIKDTISGLPMIPGSSLKGKMRTLLARRYNAAPGLKPDEDDARVLRLFGTSEKHQRSRLLIFDMFLVNGEELHKKGAQSLTEVKFENAIDRATAVANPRQIERVLRESKFELDMIYEAEKAEEIEEDFQLISEGLKLLQYDYLGGSGSRGYGKVKFHDLAADLAVGDVDDAQLDRCKQLLEEI